MKITLEALKEKGADIDYVTYFQYEFPNGGDYHEVINKYLEPKYDLPEFSDWLIDSFGATTDVLNLGDFKGAYLYFPGRVVANSINVKNDIRVGKEILVNYNVKAGKGSIRVGNGGIKSIYGG